MKLLRALWLLVCASGAEAQSTHQSLQEIADGLAPLDVYSISASYGEDESYSVQLGGDWAVGDSLRIRLDGALTESPSDLADLTTYRGKLALDYFFDPVGLVLGYEYWGDGDGDELETHAGLGELYYRGAQFQVAALGQFRRIELHFDLGPTARQYIDDSRTIESTAYGLSAHYDFTRVTLRANAMQYDYDVPVAQVRDRVDLSRVPVLLRPVVEERLRRRFEGFRQLSASTLTLANSFLDESYGGGIEVRVGDSSLDLDAGYDRAAIGDLIVRSLSLGWLAPLASVGDVEFRLGASRADELGTSVFGTVSCWFYR